MENEEKPTNGCEKARQIIEAYKEVIPQLEDFGEYAMENALCNQALAELAALEADNKAKGEMEQVCSFAERNINNLKAENKFFKIYLGKMQKGITLSPDEHYEIQQALKE